MKLLLTTIGALTLAVNIAYATPQNLDKIIQEATVTIDENCSGTTIDVENKLILTAYHCVSDKHKTDSEGIETIETLTISQETFNKYDTIEVFKYDAKIVYEDPDHDIAILQSLGERLPKYYAPKIHRGEYLKVAQKVFHVGAPKMEKYVYIEGYVSRVYKAVATKSGTRYGVQIVAPGIGGGSSGGAIYNEAGEIVGIVSLGREDLHMTIMIPFTDILSAVKKAEEIVAEELRDTAP